MKIRVKVKNSDRVLYDFVDVPRKGERIIYEYTEEFVVRDVVHQVGYGDHDITIIVEKI